MRACAAQNSGVRPSKASGVDVRTAETHGKEVPIVVGDRSNQIPIDAHCAIELRRPTLRDLAGLFQLAPLHFLPASLPGVEILLIVDVHRRSPRPLHASTRKRRSDSFSVPMRE